jgi:hypothetical protein
MYSAVYFGDCTTNQRIWLPNHRIPIFFVRMAKQPQSSKSSNNIVVVIYFCPTKCLKGRWVVWHFVTLMLFHTIHNSNDYCENCGASICDFSVIDKLDGAQICTSCGFVIDKLADWPTVSFTCPSAVDGRRIEKRNQVPYQRVYHANERIAQRNNEDPRVPRHIITTMQNKWMDEGIRDFNLLTMQKIQMDLRNAGWKKFCERWVQILYRATCGDPDEILAASDSEVCDLPIMINGRLKRRRGEDRRACQQPALWKHSFMTKDMIYDFRGNFACISRAFDALFFKPGARRTSKCVIWDNTGKKNARHNLLHYNYLFRQLHLLFGGNECVQKYEALYFFPLLRTSEVVRKLNCLWFDICKHLHIDQHFIELVPDSIVHQIDKQITPEDDQTMI